MSAYQVSWETKETPERKSRKLATEDEARAFIKGLKICGLYVRVVMWHVADDGTRERLQIGHPSAAAVDPV